MALQFNSKGILMPQELIVNTAAVAFSKKKYTDKEVALMKEIEKNPTGIEVVIPDTISADEFDVALSAVCKVIVRAQLQTESLMPVLGRLLFIASKNPELYSKKFESFGDFRESIQERFGVGRSTCFEAQAFCERWSAIIPADQFKEIGRVKMNLISKAVAKGKEGLKKSVALIEAAKEMTIKELGAFCEKEGYFDAGSTTGSYIKFECNKAQQKRSGKFYDDPRVHAVCGTDDQATIHDMMIQECSNEWFMAGQEKIDNLAAEAQIINGEAQPEQAEA
jgi:hypothetical protein